MNDEAKEPRGTGANRENRRAEAGLAPHASNRTVVSEAGILTALRASSLEETGENLQVEAGLAARASNFTVVDEAGILTTLRASS